MPKTKFKEREMIKLVDKGVLSIDDKGQIWKHEVWDGRWGEYRECHTRAEISSGRYLRVRIKRKSFSCKCSAARLIWQYHNGDIPEGLEINHMNGMKKDNRLCNLEIVTHKENIRHALDNGFRQAARGEQCYTAKLKTEDVYAIRWLYHNYEPNYSVIGRMYDVSPHAIFSIISGRTWKHLEETP